MLGTGVQEWEEYDARLMEFPTEAEQSATQLPRSQDELEGPFLLETGETEAETEGFEAERTRRSGHPRPPRSRPRRPAPPQAAGDSDWDDTTADLPPEPVAADSGEYSETESLEPQEEAWEGAQTQALTEPTEALVEPAESFEVDPYAAIRPALSPQHANLPANELTVVLGRMPATLVLHQLLNSAEMRHATLASLLGRRGRRSVRLNGSYISIPAYLRMVARLCGEVAEQSEAELSVGSQEAPARRPVNKHTGPGKYLIKIDTSSGVIRAWLFNFDIDSAKLKPGHEALLRNAVGPVIQDGGAIKLLGLASTTGQAAYDQKLGEARIHAVVTFLRRHFGNKFKEGREVSFGKEMALAFAQSTDPRLRAAGTADYTESPLWRAVVINAWNRSDPPPPPAGVDVPVNNPSWVEESKWEDHLEKGIDISSFGLHFVNFLAEVAELNTLADVTGVGVLVTSVIEAILALPLTWAQADGLANANGQIQGASDAIQDMADQYSSDALDTTPLSKWPAVKIPELHSFPSSQPTASELAWRAGQVAGRRNAVQRILDLEQHPKPVTLPSGRHVRLSGRLWLRTISKKFKDLAGVEVVIKPVNEFLKRQGHPPFPTFK
jgi:outer membrane protein OmpA-like peptidoglycan-associated protein